MKRLGLTIGVIFFLIAGAAFAIKEYIHFTTDAAEVELVELAKESEAPSPTSEPTPTPTPTPKPMTPQVMALLDQNQQVMQEMNSREFMSGRLLIPDSWIDVALIVYGEGADDEEILQNVCDAYDSAALFSDGITDYIADHNNQSFATLYNVKEGDRAYILRGYSIVSLKCTVVMKGHNYGEGIVDENDERVTGLADYVCYTCDDNWNNVTIVGFDIIDVDYIDN